MLFLCLIVFFIFDSVKEKQEREGADKRCIREMRSSSPMTGVGDKVFLVICGDSDSKVVVISSYQRVRFTSNFPKVRFDLGLADCHWFSNCNKRTKTEIGRLLYLGSGGRQDFGCIA
ncbi:hypothetical protein HanPSC8_Chr01g0014181 [Helianthus annuus]|nr:hypothetical protein HanPSC8_Chr01g0014181 [Helianthus annuus]